VTPLPSSAGHAAADPARSQPPDAESRRAIELDALSAVLPLGSRDRMAELLSDGEVETLRHLARAGVRANTLRAMASDLAHLEAWSLAAGGAPLPWPARKRSSCVSSPSISTTPSAARKIPRTACPMRSRRRCVKAGDYGSAVRTRLRRPVGDLPSLARPRGPVFVAEPARSAPPRRPRRPAAARTQERETPDPRGARAAHRSVRRRQARRPA
jgi:hypothetical protein